MKIIGTILALALLISLLFGVGYGVISGYEFLSVQWQSLSDDWKAILVIITTILILCALFISLSIQSSIKTYGLKGTGKVMTYNDFIHWYSQLKNNNAEALDAELLRPMMNQMILWGSKQVVRQTNLLYDLLQQDGVDKDQILKKAEHVYIEIRRDLGFRGSSADNAIH